MNQLEVAKRASEMILQGKSSEEVLAFLQEQDPIGAAAAAKRVNTGSQDRLLAKGDEAVSLALHEVCSGLLRETTKGKA